MKHGNRKAPTAALAGVAAALIASLAAGPADAAPDLRSGTVLVFGDSITSRYTDDPGDPMQGWWSRLAIERDLYPVISAQGGGGLVKKGNGCDGTSLRERTASVIDRVRPDEIWIAVGKNDTKVCKHGVAVPVAAQFRATAATRYFAQVAAQADSLGIARANIYVTVPWGTASLYHRRAIVLLYSSAARAAGLSFINTPRMGTALTKDGTHPNSAGSAYIAQVFGAKMNPHVAPDTGPEVVEPPAVTRVQ